MVTKKRMLLIASFFAVLLLVLGLCLFGMNMREASALTYTTPKYLTQGRTTNETSVKTGCPSNFKVYMYGSSTSGTGTLSQGTVIDWSKVTITVEPSAVSSHMTFTLLRNGSTYTTKSLSGNGNITLYSGSLSNGSYELQYSCRYAPNFLVDYTYFFYTFQFEVDKTAPSYTLQAGGSTISSGSYTNKQIVYSASDDHFSSIKYRRPGSGSYSTYYSGAYTVAATDANNGWWYFYATDTKGQTSSTVSVYLDTVKPVGKVTNAGGTTIANGGYTNSAVKYTATDTGGVSKYEVKKPGSSAWTSYTSGTSLSGTNGWYCFRATDKAGNISDEYEVYYDATVPTGSLYGGTSLKSSGGYTNAQYVKYVASDSGSGIAYCYVRMPGSSVYTAYASGTQLATEGTYYFYCKDHSGNASSAVSITLDKTKPAGTLYGGADTVQSGGSTNAAYIKFVAYDAIGISSVYVKKPGASAYTAYTSGTQLTQEGTYSFYAVDKASNVSETYTVTLDRKIPAAQLYADNDAIASGGYTNAEHIRFESAGECFVKRPGSDSFEAYISGVEYYQPGKYTFYAETESGTVTEYYTVVIDRTEKPLMLDNVTDGKTDGDVTLSWTDGDAELYAPIVSVTVNGKAYTKGSVIYTIDTGVYEIVCTDAAGNIWTTEFASRKQNVLTETLQKEYWEAYNTEGEAFAFATYDAAFKFAAEREYSFVRTGEWNSETWDAGIAMDAKDSVNAANGKYFIYKKSGNPEEEVAYFTEERLYEVISEYAAIGIESYYYWEKTPAAISDGENLYSYSDGKKVLANSVQLSGNIVCYLNGEPFTGTLIESEGESVLTVADEWGNTCEYELIVVRAAPAILYTTGAGSANTVTFDRTYYFKDAVTVSISDPYDEMAMFCVYGKDGTLIGKFSIGETYTITGSGGYTVEAVNHAGKSQTFALVVSRNAPSVEMTENGKDKTLEITITESEDKESSIQTLEIYKSLDGGETWELLTQDDYGKVIAVGTWKYSFRTSGLYRVAVTDEFRTGIDAVTAEKEYRQPAPEGILSGVENGGYTNGAVTFEWKDEAVVTVKKDGQQIEYVSGKRLTEDGAYEIVFANFDGHSVTYTFTIDTKAPAVSLSGVKEGETVSGDVVAVFDGEGVTAELFKDGNSLGAYVSGTPVTESGEYRLTVTDLAQNRTTVSFMIDKSVDFVVNVNDKGLSNSVTITANEEVTIVFTKNGEAAEYELGNVITEPALYTITLTDVLGNKAELTFTIVEPLVQKFEHNFDDTPDFEKVLVGGEEKRLNYGTLELVEDGTYEVGVVVSGKTYSFTVTVDGTAPTLKLNGVESGGSTTGSVALTEPSETAEVKVFRGGQEIEYKLGETITEEGNYRVTVTDECGNSTVYTFTIEAGTNWTLIVLGIVFGLLIAGGVVFFIVRRRKVSDQDED